MAKAITMSFPHSLSPDEVRRRIDSAIADARAQHPGQASSLQENWTTPTHGEFRLSAMAQTITGHVDIHPDAVQVSVHLPWLLAPLINRLRPEIESRARRLLENKPS